MYNKYYNSLEDTKFAKHPAYWLSDKRYLDEAPSHSNESMLFRQRFVQILKVLLIQIKGFTIVQWSKKQSMKTSLPEMKAHNIGKVCTKITLIIGVKAAIFK